MSSQLFSSCPGSSSTPLMLMILVSWFLIWWFCSGLNSLSCAEGTPLCRSEPVPGEAPHLEGRFSCPPHSGLWDNLSHVCMYIVLPFSPNTKPTVLTQAVLRLIKLSIPVSHVWLGVTFAVSSGQTRRKAANCNFFFPACLYQFCFN